MSCHGNMGPRDDVDDERPVPYWGTNENRLEWVRWKTIQYLSSGIPSSTAAPCHFCGVDRTKAPHSLDEADRP